MTRFDDEREMEELRQLLATNRASWVPKIAPKARADKEGWHLGDINGTSGESLLIYRDPNHRTHIDFNREQWKGDDLDLIRELKGISDFPELKRHAAELVNYTFDRKGNGAAANKAKTAKAGEDQRRHWAVIKPVPADTPLPPRPRAKPGETFEARHCYRDRDGAVLMFVDRFREPDGVHKRFQPWTWRQPPGQSGRAQWVPYAPPDPQPLYGLDRLPGTTQILLVEGEKKADGAQDMALPEGMAVLSVGATGKVERVDFSAVAGLPVTGWPDHDHDGGGRKAMIAALLRCEGAGAIDPRLVTVPESFPDKWDLADPWPEPDADPDVRVREMIAAAIPVKEAVAAATSDQKSGREHLEDPPPSPVVPAFPDEARYGLLGEIVTAWEPETEAHPAALLGSLLVMFGNAAGRGPYMLHAGAEHRLNLNLLVVGATARSRKGTSRALAERMFRSAHTTWLEDCNASGFGSGEALIEAVRDPHPTGKMDKKGNEIILPGARDKRLLVTEGEFTRIIAVMQREGSVLSAVLRDAWDGRPLQIKTRINPAKATGAHISVLAHITAEELQRNIDRTELVNGFLNRFILVHVHRTRLLPMGGNLPPNIADLTERLRRALDKAQRMGLMHFSPAAAQLWTEEYARLEQERPGLLNYLTVRASPQVLRLAMIHAATDGSLVIEPAHLSAALAFWSYCEASEALIFGDSTGDPTADTIAEALRGASPERLSRNDILNLFNRNRSGSEIARALALLARLGHAEKDNQPGKGRPVERWKWIG